MKNNQSGFTLIETVISAAVLSGVGYLVATQMQVFNKTVAQGDVKYQLEEKTSEITRALKNPDMCAAFVGGKAIASVAIGNLSGLERSSVGDISSALEVPIPRTSPVEYKVVFHPSQKRAIYPGSRFMIDKIKLVNVDGQDLLKVFYVKLDNPQDLTRFTSHSLVNIPISGSKDNNGQFTSCVGEVKNPESKDQCNRLNGFSWTGSSCIQTIDYLTKDSTAIEAAPMFIHPVTKQIVAKVVTFEKEVSCKCGSKKCALDENCSCGVPACPPDTLRSAIERVTKTAGWISHRCDMVASCYKEDPVLEAMATKVTGGFLKNVSMASSSSGNTKLPGDDFDYAENDFGAEDDPCEDDYGRMIPGCINPAGSSAGANSLSRSGSTSTGTKTLPSTLIKADLQNPGKIVPIESQLDAVKNRR